MHLSLFLLEIKLRIKITNPAVPVRCIVVVDCSNNALCLSKENFFYIPLIHLIFLLKSYYSCALIYDFRFLHAWRSKSTNSCNSFLLDWLYIDMVYEWNIFQNISILENNILTTGIFKVKAIVGYRPQFKPKLKHFFQLLSKMP